MTRSTLHRAAADLAMAAIRGVQDAQRVLHVIAQGHAPADALHEAAEAVVLTGEHERMRAFFRQLQKVLERGMP